MFRQTACALGALILAVAVPAASSFAATPFAPQLLLSAAVAHLKADVLRA